MRGEGGLRAVLELHLQPAVRVVLMVGLGGFHAVHIDGGVLPIARNVATNLPFVMRAASANTVERSSAGRWLRTPYRHRQISTLQSGSGIRSRISPTSNRRLTPA